MLWVKPYTHRAEGLREQLVDSGAGTFKPIAAPDTRMTSPMTQTMSCALSRPRITRV